MARLGECDICETVHLVQCEECGQEVCEDCQRSKEGTIVCSDCIEAEPEDGFIAAAKKEL